ncbi:MAG TPA: thermonuclease family protein [Nannocystaceae bacterium]|nr:thermonuclease family protein [Nannocystaceae bacterium]
MTRPAEILAAILAAAGAHGCTDGAPADRCGPREAVVAEVIDGDTIELDSGERVRYLLVDTPESTNGKNDCYGHEASDFNRDLVLGRTIALEYDEVCTDAYDRLLAYVELDGRDINALLVERGYACVLQIPPNGADRVDEFESLELAAQTGLVGMWGACEEITCD